MNKTSDIGKDYNKYLPQNDLIKVIGSSHLPIAGFININAAVLPEIPH